MLVLAIFLAIGLFSIAFLLRFWFALHAEMRFERERDARTKQLLNRRIPIAVDTRATERGFFVTSSNSGIVWPSTKAGLPAPSMRQALAALSRRTTDITESSQGKKGA